MKIQVKFLCAEGMHVMYVCMPNRAKMTDEDGDLTGGLFVDHLGSDGEDNT